MASPLEISIALHYWTTPGDYDGLDRGGMVQEIVTKFEGLGLLEVDRCAVRPCFKKTPGLEAYVRALCAVPYPVKQWVTPPVVRPISALPLPHGYRQLPEGVKCRCANLWTDGAGNYWCCGPVEGSREYVAVKSPLAP